MMPKMKINCPNCGKECNAFISHYCRYCGCQLNIGDFE